MTKAKLGADAIAYTYDALGRVLSEKDAANRTTSYAYDDAAGEVRLTWPTGQWVDYENDSLNRLETIRNSAGAALADYTYDTLSRVTAIDYGNGATQSYTYENDGDLDTVVQNFAGTADDVTFDYAYNAAGQVTSKDLTNNAYLWTPGANVTTSYTTNNLNQYTNIGGQAISYDTKGNLTSDGTLTFIYDSENKLKEAKDGAVTIGAYSYDPVGRRAEKTASGATTEYAYAGVDVIAEYNGTGTLLRRIVPGGAIDAPIAFYDEDAAGDPIFYLHYDGQGSVIGVSDSTGANTEKYTYGPFGETPVTTGSPYHYVARRIDQETGLYYVRARYYNPEIGRFLSPDPIGYGDGLNMYAYVSNDPVNLRDPLGLMGVDDDQLEHADDASGSGNSSSGSGSGGGGGGGRGPIEQVTVTAPRLPTPGTGFQSIPRRSFVIVSLVTGSVFAIGGEGAGGGGGGRIGSVNVVSGPTGGESVTNNPAASSPTAGQAQCAGSAACDGEVVVLASNNKPIGAFNNRLLGDHNIHQILTFSDRFQHIVDEHTFTGLDQSKGAFFDEFLVNRDIFETQIVASGLENADSVVPNTRGRPGVLVEANFWYSIGYRGTNGGRRMNWSTDRARYNLRPLGIPGVWFVYTAFPIDN